LVGQQSICSSQISRLWPIDSSIIKWLFWFFHLFAYSSFKHRNLSPGILHSICLFRFSSTADIYSIPFVTSKLFHSRSFSLYDRLIHPFLSFPIRLSFVVRSSLFQILFSTNVLNHSSSGKRFSHSFLHLSESFSLSRRIDIEFFLFGFFFCFLFCFFSCCSSNLIIVQSWSQLFALFQLKTSLRYAHERQNFRDHELIDEWKEVVAFSFVAFQLSLSQSAYHLSHTHISEKFSPSASNSFQKCCSAQFSSVQFNSVHSHDFQTTDVHPAVPCSVHMIDV
jgi:hypothetical protein